MLAVYQEDNEDDLVALAPLFIKQQTGVLSALSKLQKARTDQLRKVVGPPTTILGACLVSVLLSRT
jgi:hypothetical protein